ncbi:MAG: pyrroline-5-carboxylate reductase family protein, partial [Deltaproteobacteria bacterium]
QFLVSNTGKGIVVLLTKTGLAPGELRNQVASKGGTTEAALKVLHSGGTLEEAVKAALKRAQELSKE